MVRRNNARRMIKRTHLRPDLNDLTLKLACEHLCAFDGLGGSINSIIDTSGGRDDVFGRKVPREGLERMKREHRRALLREGFEHIRSENARSVTDPQLLESQLLELRKPLDSLDDRSVRCCDEDVARRRWDGLKRV